MAAREEVGSDALREHGLHLVLDERDERAHDHGEPVLVRAWVRVRARGRVRARVRVRVKVRVRVRPR